MIIPITVKVQREQFADRDQLLHALFLSLEQLDSNYWWDLFTLIASPSTNCTHCYNSKPAIKIWLINHNQHWVDVLTTSRGHWVFSPYNDGLDCYNVRRNVREHERRYPWKVLSVRQYACAKSHCYFVCIHHANREASVKTAHMRRLAWLICCSICADAKAVLCVLLFM